MNTFNHLGEEILFFKCLIISSYIMKIYNIFNTKYSRDDVQWMGWKPVRVTFTSDYFDQLYDLAVKLILADKAYICHQSKADIEVSLNNSS